MLYKNERRLYEKFYFLNVSSMLKYSVGLDIGSETIYACICVIDAEQKTTVKSSLKINNTTSGFKQLVQWMVRHRKKTELPLVIAMEATGIYYENCAWFLSKEGYGVSVILPNKAKKWLQADGYKSKNDKIDAQGLSKMGAEKSLDVWQPAAEFYCLLRTLTRQHQSLQEHKTAVNNQLHAEERGMYVNKLVVKQLNKHIKLLDAQLLEMEDAIKEHIYSDSQVALKVDNICKIKGVGLLTTAVILAETNGFALFKNAPQLVSYAGYDVIENQSGNRKGKTKISKKGNSRIRRILFMPAFSTVTCKQKPFIDLYDRTFERHGMTMKSYVAVQKKILVIMYALWKKNEPYDADFVQKNTKDHEQVLPLGT